MRHRVAGGILIIGLLLVMCAAQAQNKERVAFQREGSSVTPSNIVIMFADDSNRQELGQHKELAGRRVTPALSPDGHTLAFSAQVGEHYRIFTWSLDDHNQVVGAPWQLTPEGDTSDKFPSWSADGKQLAYLATSADGKSTLRVINVDGTGMKELSDAAPVASPAWKPDGTAILYFSRENGHQVLRYIMPTGGISLKIPMSWPKGQPLPRITAACYSPDGAHIAALVLREDGSNAADLWMMTNTGKKESTITQRIDGATSISWPQPDRILFNASKVGSSTGHTLWEVTAKGGPVKGLSSLNDAKHVSYFSVQQSSADALIPSADNPSGLGPDQSGPGTERSALGAVTIIRPYANTTVRGDIPIKIVAKKDVVTVVLRINDQFVYAGTAIPAEDTAPQASFDWDTQELLTLDPKKEKTLPSRYQSALRYPDGDYVISAIGLDASNKQVGEKDSIKVTVENAVRDAEPTMAYSLHYQYREAEPTVDFTIHGEGVAYGADPQTQGALFATLDILARHTLIEQRPSGKYDIRMEMQEVTDHYPLQFGLSEVPHIPETYISALYTVGPNGDIEVVPQQRVKVYLPLAQVFTPLPDDAKSIGYQWSADMWVVTDLLERKAVLAKKAQHTLEGVEWIGNRRTIRIRSDYTLDSRVPDAPSNALALTPIATAPGLRGTQPPATSLEVSAVSGVRYTWFDYQRCRISRIEDLVLYEFPLNAAPPTTTAGAPPVPAPPMIDPKRSGASGYYVVRYTYTGVYDDLDSGPAL